MSYESSGLDLTVILNPLILNQAKAFYKLDHPIVSLTITQWFDII